MKEQTGSNYILQLGTKLKKLRIHKNLTQLQLANLTGLGVKTISNVELGKPFSLKVLFQILEALDHDDAIMSFIDSINIDSKIKEKKRVKPTKSPLTFRNKLSGILILTILIIKLMPGI